MASIAAVQMTSGAEVAVNLAAAGRLIGEAAQAGARLVVLPENFAIMGVTDAERVAAAEPDGSGPIQDFLAQSAHQHRVWLVGGTMPMRARAAAKVRAASLLYDDRGERV